MSNCISYRRLNIEDRQDLLEHYMKLSKNDRYLRFLHDITDEALKKCINRIGFVGEAVIGAYYTTAPEKKPLLIGVVLIVPTNSDSKVAEVALSVDALFRCMHCGSTLLEQAITHARNKGYSHLSMECLYNNESMLRLAHRSGFTIELDQGFYYTGRLKL